MLNSFSFQFECIARIVIAALCGAVIGLERKNRLKEAGTRTHLVVAFGSALFMVVSKYGFFDIIEYAVIAELDIIKFDPTRIASTIVTGVGFLGAGTIFVRRQMINGLTTAAGLWATAAIGMAIGGGQYIVGLIGTLILVLFQWILHKVTIFNKISSDIMVFKVYLCEDPATVVETLLDKYGIDIRSVKLDKSVPGEILVECLVKMPKALNQIELSNEIAGNTLIKSVEF